jgi:hypothetical protein
MSSAWWACPQRELDDATAYMMLVTCNAQSGLNPLEKGLHALRSEKGVREYARALGGVTHTAVEHWRNAAKVATQVATPAAELIDRTRHLTEIHAAPAWLWPALVAAMLPSTRPMGEGLVDPAQKFNELENCAPPES